jgi:hypothetical protein
VRLELFWGAAEQTAHTIDHKYFLPLLNWLRSCQMQLRASQLPPELWVATTLGTLRGAARASFTRIHGDAPINNWTFEQFQLALTSLVPKHAAQFSRAALALKFSVKSLCDDIAQFALTIRHWELAPDSQFIFGQLQDKMLEAWPDIFSVSTSRFNLQLDYVTYFERQIEMAQKIASRLQCEGILDSLREKRNRPQVEDTRMPALCFSKKPRMERGYARAHQSKRPAHGKAEEFKKLARQYHRCYGCGYYLVPGAIEAHRKDCRKDPKTFKRIMGHLKRQIEADPMVDPNERYKGPREVPK